MKAYFKFNKKKLTVVVSAIIIDGLVPVHPGPTKLIQLNLLFCQLLILYRCT